ncbi:MAG: adenylate kinase [Kiritimatiellae bacterium]|nr:adenylate kinase [Kiritimatiellia bacterium]
MKIVILLGAPGSGKGTMAERLSSQDPVFRHLSSGSMLREAVSNQTRAGRLAEGAMKRGELVSDELIAEMIKDTILGIEGECTLLLDGFPRTVAQAAILDQMIESCGAQLWAVVWLDVDEEDLVDRIVGRRVCLGCGAGYHIETILPEKDGVCDLCGEALVARKDDNLETIRHRLSVYKASTMPLIDLYRSRGLLRRVMSAGAINETVELVKNALG